MRKNKLFLSLIAVCSIVGMGITSCNSEPVQGPQGEQGPVGPQGPAGENGENGEDGSLILHGEGKPADTLGKDTDVYIDSKTGDLYQKENGSWTLVMNIKGEDGEDGKDGSNGSNGTDGEDGKSTFSNTILPIEGGYILPDKGSYLSGETATFTFVDNNASDDFGKEKIVWVVDGVEYSRFTSSISVPIEDVGYVVYAYFVDDVETVNTRETFEDAFNSAKGDTVILLSENIDIAGLKLNNTNDAKITILGETGDEVITIDSKCVNLTTTSSLTFENVNFSINNTQQTVDANVFNINSKEFNLSNVDITFTSTSDNKFTSFAYMSGNDVRINLDHVTINESYDYQSLISNINEGSIASITISDSVLYGVELFELQSVKPDFTFTVENSKLHSSTVFIFLANYGFAKDAGLNVNFNFVNSTFDSQDPNVCANLMQINAWGNYNAESKEFTPYDNLIDFSGVNINVDNFTMNGTLLTSTTDVAAHYINTLVENETSDGQKYPASRRFVNKTGLVSVYGAAWVEHYLYAQILTNPELYPSVTIGGVEISRASLLSADVDAQTPESVQEQGATFTNKSDVKLTKKSSTETEIKYSVTGTSSTMSEGSPEAAIWGCTSGKYIVLRIIAEKGDILRTAYLKSSNDSFPTVQNQEDSRNGYKEFPVNSEGYEDLLTGIDNMKGNIDYTGYRFLKVQVLRDGKVYKTITFDLTQVK